MSKKHYQNYRRGRNDHSAVVKRKKRPSLNAYEEGPTVTKDEEGPTKDKESAIRKERPTK
jgi:hypothetical protein